MKRYFLLIALFGMMSSCHSKSPSQGNQPIPQPYQPNPDEPSRPVNPATKNEQTSQINPSGVWGASLFSRRCHLFYHFSDAIEDKGRYEIKLLCSGESETEAFVEEYEGEYTLSQIEGENVVIRFLPRKSSCGNGELIAAFNTLLKIDGDQLLLNQVIFKNIPANEFAARMAPLSLQKGCFKKGNVKIFSPSGEQI
ncbi:MAG: hypothetical protein ACOH5I_08785 [Oligoflexus sp.]